MNYTYTLNGVAVNPSGKWEIEFRRNEGQIFWRRYLTGELTFKGEDYNFIIGQVEELVSVSGCVELDLVIYCEDVEFWTGKFKYPYSFKFDEDNCTLTGTPEVVDEYSCIMNNYEHEYRVQYTPGANWIDGLTANGVSFAGGTLPVNSVNLWGVMEDMVSGIPALFDNMNCGLTCVSSFFNRDEFPGQAPGHYASIYGTQNYVTGAAYANNELENVYLARNNTIRVTFGGTACDNEDFETITFKFLEEIFRERFNAYWYIDEEGNFRVEHISYFLPEFLYSDFEADIDLTEILSGCHSFAERKNKYTHQTDKLFDQETWSWQHYSGTEEGITHNINWQGVPIYYGATEDEKSECVPGAFKVRDYPTPYIHTDYPWVQAQIGAANVDCLGCPGFMLLHVHNLGAAWFMASDTGAYDGVNRSNVFLSTANLQANFFTWERIFLNGTMNGGGVAPITVFDSAIKKKLQDEIEFPLCCDTEFNPMKQVTTEMGDGAVYSAVQTQYSVKIQLLYD